MGTTYNFQTQVEALFHILVQKYFIEHDFAYIRSIMHDQVSWFGTGKHEVCSGHEDAMYLLQSESRAPAAHVVIEHEWHTLVPISAESCTVYGEIEGQQTLPQQVDCPFYCRFSATFVAVEGAPRLLHLHMSSPNLSQGPTEFINKPSTDAYNALLEGQLTERTRLLNQRTRQLETITNNICGGVQLCSCDRGFTISYINSGFTDMTGYTLSDLAVFDYQHVRLVHPDDVERLVNTVLSCMEQNSSFVVEYRMMKKDGTLIWVLDKGVFVTDDNGNTQAQCILTDITLQKRQEEELKLSERRYEVAISLSGLTMFEYNILTKDLVFFNNLGDMYGINNVLHNGPESMLEQGHIDMSCAPQYREMYRKIHAGEPFAACSIMAHDKDQSVWFFELSLTTVYDSDGHPVRAIGIRKNVSDMHHLLKEQEFTESMASDKFYLFEADITNNRVLYLNNKYEYLDICRSYTAFSEFVTVFCRSFVHPSDVDHLISMLSAESLANAVENDNKLIEFEYNARFMPEENYRWYKADINIVKDPRLGLLYVRFYTRDISHIKEREQQALEEQLVYETMISKAILSYEVNLTQNIIVRGSENWLVLYKIEPKGSFSEMMSLFARQCIHPDDAAGFLLSLNRDTIITNFHKGYREFSVQYRRLYAAAEYRWVNYTMHMFEDPTSGHLKGYAYIEDIDEQKKQELALKYNAEHDKMTDLYNKKTTEQLIDAYLQSPEGCDLNHAFLMIDIDNFKNINDQLGHLVGDKALVEIAQVILRAFRDCDIIGRIGGDEFCVLMKDVPSQAAALAKADALCKRLNLTYTKGPKRVSISASIGIALYEHPSQGYMQLYSNSDIALYQAKNQGKNRYCLYCAK